MDKGQQFMIVDIDNEKELIEIQHVDGDIEEISFSEWCGMKIVTGSEPENWSGTIEVDDYGTNITNTNPEEWDEPLKEFRPPGVKDSIQAEAKARKRKNDLPLIYTLIINITIAGEFYYHLQSILFIT